MKTIYIQFLNTNPELQHICRHPSIDYVSLLDNAYEYMNYKNSSLVNFNSITRVFFDTFQILTQHAPIT